MITGHLGVAAAAGSRWPRVPFLWLLAVCIAPDLLDVGYALAGFCSPYGLYSHTLPAAALLGALLGGAAFLATGSRTAGLVTLAVVLAHLPLDLVTGHKLYWPGGELVGLDFYRRPLLDFAAEVPVVVAGWALLRRTGRGPRWATMGFVLLGVLLLQGGFDLLERGIKPSACRWTTSAWDPPPTRVAPTLPE